MIGKLREWLPLHLRLLNHTLRNYWDQRGLCFESFDLESVVQSLRNPVLVLVSEDHQGLLSVRSRVVPVIFINQIPHSVRSIHDRLVVEFTLHE